MSEYNNSSSPTQLSHLIQPPTTRNNPRYNNNGTASSATIAGSQETFIINAPRGILGVVIDTPISSHTGTTMPIVHAVKDSSPLADKIQVGDKLIAVDDEDVTSLTAIQVSKLLARKSEQEKRKLTIVRTRRGQYKY
jgi:C-terminal processing protease CtpA/Prc